MKREIPEQLRNPDFKFFLVAKNHKIPIESKHLYRSIILKLIRFTMMLKQILQKVRIILLNSIVVNTNFLRL